MTYKEITDRLSEIETLLIQKDQEYEDLQEQRDKLFEERFDLRQEHKHLMEAL